MAGLGIILGPVIGGWLLERFWWGSVFLVNLPVVALAIGAGWPLVPESRDPDATPLDPTGAALSVAALVTLVSGIIQAPEHSWTAPVILGAFGVAAVLSVAFIWWERRVQHPMLPMERTKGTQNGEREQDASSAGSALIQSNAATAVGRVDRRPP